MLDELQIDMAEVVGRQTFAAGTHAWGPLLVPLGATQVLWLLSRADVTTLTGRFDWALEVTYDAGLTWESLGGAGLELTTCGKASGDFAISNYGRASGSQRPLADPMNGRRLLRGTLTTRESATLSVTVEFT